MSEMADIAAQALNPSSGMDIKALLRSSRRAESTVPICLRGDLVAEFETLERQLAERAVVEAAKPKDTRLNTPSDTGAQGIAERMLAVQQQMMDATVTFRLRALLPSKFSELQAEHPPRKGEDGSVLEADSGLNFNVATFWPALVRESVISPVLDDEDWAMLLGTAEPGEGETPEDVQARGLNDGQWDDLVKAAWTLNRKKVDIPFSRAASRILASSAPE
jgi:hypothetical protein